MNRRGFTLIELLVVSAIIAVLIGILVPTLSLARKRAQASVCLSNLRQIGLAMLYYGYDNNDVIARASMTADAGPPTQPFKVKPWGEALVPYLLTWKKDGFSRTDVDAGEVFGRLFRGVYRCPADMNHITENWVYSADFDQLYNNGHWSYGKNVIFEYNPNYPRGKGYQDRSKFRLIPVPQTTVLFAEILAEDMSDHFMVDQWGADGSDTTVDFARHGSTSNYIFCDLHAESARLGQIYDLTRGVNLFDPDKNK